MRIIVMGKIVCALAIAHNVKFGSPNRRVGLRCGFPAAGFFGRAARGSVAPRKMACRSLRGSKH
jgi:hypothetical protein